MSDPRRMITLGIETSCDETSAAVLKGPEVLASEIYTQQIHAAYGGVVPEMASRAHLKKIDVLCRAVYDRAGMRPDQTDLVAVTDSPGLAGALLVGIGFGLGLHIGYGMPVTGVNHLEGHVYSALLERPDLSPPFLSLVVSGGHTALYAVRDPGRYECLGKTVDDAAGEAFDKVGKLLGFSYPAGRAVEEEAARARPDGDLKFPIARLSTPGPGFSFSGLKTAVRYFIQSKGAAYVNDHRPQICRAFQEAVVGSLLLNSRIAADRTGIERIAVVGGVACNGRLRRAFGDAFGVNAIFPPPKYCTDNAAMIARAGVECFKRNELRRPSMNPVGRI